MKPKTVFLTSTMHCNGLFPHWRIWLTISFYGRDPRKYLTYGYLGYPESKNNQVDLVFSVKMFDCNETFALWKDCP